MRALVIYSSVNSPNLNDAIGAFVPESRFFAKTHALDASLIRGFDLVNTTYSQRKRAVGQAILDAGSVYRLDSVIFFCHGWSTGLQAGWRRHELIDLVSLLSRSCSSTVKIALYACLTAENDTPDHLIQSVGPGTDGGFADILRDELVRANLTRCQVDAHKTRGHATWNPFLVRFSGVDVVDRSTGGIGGKWLITPQSELWSRWVDKLNDRAAIGLLRYRFPYMTADQIVAELRG